MEFSCDAAHNQSYYSNSWIVLPSIILQSYFPFCFVPLLLFTCLSLFSVCMFVFFLIILPPNTRLCWAATNYAEDQGQAWIYIRKAPGLYVFLCLSLSLFYLSVMTFIFCTLYFTSGAHGFCSSELWLLIPLNGEIHPHTFHTGFCFIQLSQCHSLQSLPPISTSV